MSGTTIKIIKIGGKLIEDDSLLERLCDSIATLARSSRVIVVHGGGAMAGRLAERMGVRTRMHEGRRITDAQTLDITVMAYAGLANKKITARLQSAGVNACGLSGCDMGIVLSHRRTGGEIDWGYVGDIDNINAEALHCLLSGKILPVISPITFNSSGQLLNTNADSVASSVAEAMAAKGEVELTFCLDKPGVLEDIDDNSSAIRFITPASFAVLASQGKVHSGMIPKLENAFRTINAGVSKVRITDAANLEGGTIVTNKQN